MAALAHPPDRFITLPLRKGKENMPDWGLCIKYVSVNHSSNNTSTVEAAFKRMGSLHSAIIQTCRPDTKTPPTEGFIEHTLKPYCQLVAMAQAHLPLHGGQVSKSLVFSWKDSFDSNHRNESQNSNLELLCCIYNLGASHAQVAAQQAQSGSVEDVKNAFKGFQNAAGYYDMVKNLLNRLPPEHVKTDLTTESLSLLSKMCLTMAHHCAYLKAENDMKGNHAMLAKIAREGAKQYEETANAIKGSAWYAIKKSAAQLNELICTTMSLVFNARSHLHLAVSNGDAGEMGICIGHFEQAQKFLGRLPVMPTVELRSWINDIVNTVNKEHEKSIAANESVYYMRIAKDVDGPSGLPRPLGKAMEHKPFTSFESKRGEDPFFGIVPAHIAAAAAAWRDKQRQVVSVCTKSCAAARSTVEDKFQTLGVTAAIEVLSGESRDRGVIPAHLYERIESLHRAEKGHTTSVVDSLVAMVKACDNLWLAANAKLDQVKKEIEEEKKEDNGFAEAYGERFWRASRPPATDLAEFHSIQAAIDKQQGDLQTWFVKPFSKAKAAFESSVRDLARLDWPKSDLDALMPFVETSEARQQNTKVMEQVEELRKLMKKKQLLRETLDAKVRELNEMIESDAAVFGLSSVEASQRDAVLSKASQEISDAVERVNHSKRELEEVLPAVEAAMESLGCLQSSDPIMVEMQQVCNGLENACTICGSLRQEFDDVTRYGSRALDTIESMLSTAQSLRTSRMIEAEGLREMLDEQIKRKVQEMQRSQQGSSALEESRRRQDELQQQIAALEENQRQQEPGRAERMAEILRRQRESAMMFGGIESNNPTMPPPQTQPSPPPLPNTPADLPPPSYDSVINNAYRYHPPPL